MKDAERGGKAGFNPGCRGAGGRARGSRSSRDSAGIFSFFFFLEVGSGISGVLEAGGCLEVLAAGKGLGREKGGTETWQSARGSYKGMGSSPGGSGFVFGLELGCKSRFSEIFRDLWEPWGAGGAVRPHCGLAGPGSEGSACLNSLISGDALSDHPAWAPARHGMA